MITVCVEQPLALPGSTKNSLVEEYILFKKFTNTRLSDYLLLFLNAGAEPNSLELGPNDRKHPMLQTYKAQKDLYNGHSHFHEPVAQSRCC